MQWNLIRLRKENILTQKQVADRLKINLNTYIRKENGESQFKANEMFILSKLFGKRIEEIFLPTDCINNAIIKEGSNVNATTECESYNSDSR
jgi:DNA-binding XRE family transcriptional regulator